MNEFNVGDAVQLKGGGPIMTVVEVGEHDGKPTVWTVWFENMKESRSSYPVNAVELFRP